MIETHLHADFVSGHRELAARSGAEIVFGARANAAFPHRAVHDGEVLRIGGVELQAIETPGHTPDSISWLVSENGRPSKLMTGDTAVMRLARVGIDNIAGYITSLDGFTTASLPQLTVRDLYGTAVLDVRRRAEFWEGHVTNAENVPLDELPDRLSEVDRDHPLAVICAGGYRSSIACSLLARARFTNVMNVQGGTEEWMRGTRCTSVNVAKGEG